MSPGGSSTLRQALAVEPQSQRFTEGQRGALEAVLNEAARSSVFMPVSAPREVLLDAEGRTQAGGSRFTYWAFFQLCQAISPGLYRLLTELSGAQRTPDQPRADYSFDEAVSVLNMLIRRRFATRLYGLQMLRDSRTNIIHGLVGSSYRWLPNGDLYDRTAAVVASSRRPVRFHEAILNGRWLLLRFRHEDPYFSVRGGEEGDVYSSGFHFSNNEVGLASVRASALLIRREGGTASMTTPVRLIHSAQRSFDQKLEMLLSGVTDRLKEPDFYRRHVLRLEGVPLRLGSRDERAERRRRDDLAYMLARRKLSIGLAKRAVAGAAAVGSHDGPRADMTRALRGTVASRTAYDLYNALGREARRLTISAQEHAEQVAYALLSGRLVIE